ncbi:SHS2 domain-containing protein [Micromonospora kangleipakensis]|uniref:SHS2 domain-containing protein n=1 Tax=Micromonospora kangleipakensis TaxID=1077942 RepID=A0A4Q8BEQ4_9ACTN|nr:archease [Micromonospora kangleipakensis]RZU75703.1 SHS2 domain-containing protein [Micromonospora kangleipakensis]
MDRRPPRGHRMVPHTADVRIEAWAPDREGCVAEAVTALVDTFVDTTGATPEATVEFQVPSGDDPDLLVGVLNEVIFRLETEGDVPLATEVRAANDGGLLVRWHTTGSDAVELVGAVPKAVSLHELRFGRGQEGWSGAVTLDV